MRYTGNNPAQDLKTMDGYFMPTVTALPDGVAAAPGRIAFRNKITRGRLR